MAAQNIEDLPPNHPNNWEWEQGDSPIIVNTPPSKITFTEQDELRHRNLAMAELEDPEVVLIIKKSRKQVTLNLDKLPDWNTFIMLACEIKDPEIARKLPWVFTDKRDPDFDTVNSPRRNQLRSQLERNQAAYRDREGLAKARDKFSRDNLPGFGFSAQDIYDISFPNLNKE